MKGLERLLRSKVLYQEEVRGVCGIEHLLADAGYTGAEVVMLAHGYTPHIRPCDKEARMLAKHPGKKARRWVVERTFSWLKRWRKVHTRYEKTLFSYTALLCLAIALTIFNKIV
jgi:transposase